jgi:hypothetical protein
MTAKITCTIKGQSPVLMNRFPLVPIEGLAKLTPADQAEHAAYRDEATKQLFIPGVAVQRCLTNAAKFSKGKGRSSLQTEICACLMVNPERILLGTTNYTIDTRPVVIPATKGRILKHRPRLDNWQATFELEYDPTLLKESQLRRVVDDAGCRVGLLDFRPEKKGPFGRFAVVNWK